MSEGGIGQLTSQQCSKEWVGGGCKYRFNDDNVTTGRFGFVLLRERERRVQCVQYNK